MFKKNIPLGLAANPTKTMLDQPSSREIGQRQVKESFTESLI